MKIHWGTKDGGPKSHVWCYMLEIKSLFSVGLLCFENGTREAFHSHAFNSTSWLLWGGLGETLLGYEDSTHFYWPSLYPIRTYKHTFHRVCSIGRSWVLTFRGPWDDTWEEVGEDGFLTTLTHGRKPIHG